MTRVFLVLGMALGCATVRGIPAPEGASDAVQVPGHQAQAHYLRGRLALLDGDLDAADQALSIARVFDPLSAWIPIAQGEVALVRGDVQAAAAAWEEATRVDPECGAGWLFRARVDRFQGRPAAAAGHYRRARELGVGWKAWAGEIDALVRAEQRNRAAEVMAQWALRADISAMESAERGQRRLLFGDHEGAGADLLPAVRSRPEDMGAVRRWVSVVLQWKDVSPALEQVDAIQANTQGSEALFWASAVLGDAAGDDGRVSTALEAWSEIDPEDEDLHALRKMLGEGRAP